MPGRIRTARPSGCYADVWNIEGYAPIVRRVDAGDVDSFDRRSVDSGFCYNANPEIQRVTVGDRTEIRAPGLSLTKEVIKESADTRVKFSLKIRRI